MTRKDIETRFKTSDGYKLSKQGIFIRLPIEVDAVVRGLPTADRSPWLRKIIIEAVERDLLKNN